jgi:hypothetical protein
MGTWRRAAVAPILVFLLVGPGGMRGAWGEAFRIDSPPDCEEGSLDLAALPGGGLVAVWQAGATASAGSSPRIFARLFDAHHVAAGPAFQVSGDSSAIGPAVAVGASGDFLIAWGDAGLGRLVVRHFNAAGGATGPEIVLLSAYPTGGVAVAATPTGFAVLAIQQTSVFLWRLAPTGFPLGTSEDVASTIRIPEESSPIGRDPIMVYNPAGLVLSWAEEHFGVATTGALLYTGAIQSLPVFAQEQPADDPLPLAPALAVDRAGRILVAWNESPVAWIVAPIEGWGGLRAQVFNPDGQALQEIPLWVSNSGPLGFSPPAVAADGEGFVVAWQSLSSSDDVSNATWLRRIGTDGALAGPAVFVGNTPSVSRPAVAVDSTHRVTVGWQAGVQPQFGPAVATCFSQGLYAASLEPSSQRLPLQNGRFEARVHWIDHAGHSGEGQAVPLSNDSGYFWFFGEDNVEVMVKVLDGREVNGNFWVFNGSLSDVVYTLTVTDTVTGRVSTYANRPGQLASFADTQAFPDAESASASVSATADLSAAAGLAVAPQSSQVAADQGVGPCEPPQPGRRSGLCLGDRFEVEVAWHANGTEGAGKGIGLTADSGYLWFFGPNNTELVVKVLDGRAFNGHFWVFYGALTDVEYTVRVRDTLTGAERVYSNPAGRLRSRADTAAF